jgi:hypothetical protein
VSGCVARVATLGGFAILAACGGSSEPKIDVTPATVTPTSSDTLRGAVGTQLATPISVIVKNKAGNPIDSAVVTFAVVTGAGSVGATSVRTDATGQASTTWTLGPAVGIQTATATAGLVAAVTFTAVGGAQAASAVAKASGDAQAGVAGANVAVAPSVKVTDKFGNPVAGVLVTFAVSSGGGSVTNAAANTDANGVATVGSWRLGVTAGANSLTATVSGLTPVTFTATGTAGAVAQVRITNTAPTLTVGQNFTLTAQAFDANNNRLTTATITFASDNAAVATVGSTTGTVTGIGAGTATISASSGGVSGTQVIAVLGHPGSTLVATLPVAGRIQRVVTAGNTAYAAVSTSGSVSAVDLVSATIAWTLTLGGQVVDVAVNAANTMLAAVAASTPSQLYLINTATRLATDSILLGAPPVHMVMTSAGTRAFVDENNFQLEIIDIASRAVVGTSVVPGTVNAMKMGPGDTLLYAGTAFGNVYEISVATGAIRRSFTPSTAVADLEISPDGKTLFVADGTTSVFMVPLAAGGLSGVIDFGQNVNGLGQPPDARQLWVSQGSTVYAAPAQDNSFNPSLVAGHVTVTGATLTRITFSRVGDVAVVIDAGGNQLVIIK